jgi:hypothetical protein
MLVGSLSLGGFVFLTGFYFWTVCI